MLGTCNAVGELDTATASDFRRSLYSAIDDADTMLVVVDCSLVTFLDSSAYHTLEDATAYAVSRNRVLVIRNLQPFHAKVLRICDHDRALNLDPHAALIQTVRQLESVVAPTAA